MRGRSRQVLARALVTAPAALTLGATPPAAGAQTACAAPVPSDTRPGYTIADPWCDFPGGAPFAPLTDPAGAPLSEVHAGIDDGAAWRIEVPDRWNGDLALHAHGYRGTGTTVWVDNPALRAHFVQQGFAWAASSYQTNGYDGGQGVRDTHALLDLFPRVTGHRPHQVLITGPSMGGHVTAAALTGTPITFPLRPPPDYPQTYQQQVLSELPQLGSGFVAGTPPTFTPLGMEWGAAVEQRSGGVLRVAATAAPSPDLSGIPAVTGDPVLLRPLVARPTFGCRFTDGAHASFSAPACPVGG